MNKFNGLSHKQKPVKRVTFSSTQTTRIMVSMGTWHKTSTRAQGFFRRFWVLITLIFSEIQYLLLEIIPLHIITEKNVSTDSRKMDTGIPLFFSEIQYLLLETIPLEQAFPLDILKKTQGHENSKLKDKTQ